MQDSIHELYENHVYPAMSHPLSDPAVSAVAARIGGLKTAHPAKARILEIGCCSGHNLIPLAMRWPDSEFIGIDLAETSIREANARAAVAGVTNVIFHAADLRDFKPEGGPFDFIIAHGFFSWVPDEVKAALLDFCREHLSAAGIATISFNLECGWAARQPVIQKVRAIQQAKGGDVVSALEILRMVTEPDSPEIAIIDDMFAKGPAILAFDDFGPLNDPWPLDRFVHEAASADLRWLGESDPAENFPSNLSDEVINRLAKEIADPLALQLAADAAAGRTFRSGVLCRTAAPVEARVHLGMVFDFSVRAGAAPSAPPALEIWRAIDSFAPACVTMREVAAVLPEWDERELATQVFDGITSGWILARIESLKYDPEPPEIPCLNAFRLFCAREKLPLVDAWHKPCQFPETHYAVLAAMEGTRNLAELAAFSKIHCPELAFAPWLRHLAWRGMFT
ncbi:MAG: methyltransferase domain-containing protein [Luteolibacter sp.]